MIMRGQACAFMFSPPPCRYMVNGKPRKFPIPTEADTLAITE